MDDPPSYTPIWGLNGYVLFIYLILNEEKCPCFENMKKKIQRPNKIGIMNKFHVKMQNPKV
jgi:hypothetical protein